MMQMEWFQEQFILQEIFLRPGLQIIKTAPKVSVVSSFFIMMVPDSEYGEEGMLLFSDCAVNPNQMQTNLQQ